MLTATGMRHHIATMSQIHSRQGDEYTEQLPGFFGMTSRFTLDRKSTRLNSSHVKRSRMPSSA